MKFHETQVPGAYVVELAPHEDGRGFFARAYDADEFRRRGLAHSFVQANLTRTLEAGTIRGLHFQHPPHEEAKLIRCVRGMMFQVAVDARPASPTRYAWTGVELSADNRLALYIPPGCAAGAQALSAPSEAFYLVSAAYEPASEDGLRFDDPSIGIDWPLVARNVTEKDRSWPLVSETSE